MEDGKLIQHLFEMLSQPLGFLATILLLVVWFSRWLKPIVEKLVARHLEFVDRVEKSQDTLCDRAAEHGRKLEAAEQVASLGTRKLDEVSKKLDTLTDTVRATRPH